MGIEIERKFLVVGDDWRGGVQSSSELVQGYMRAEDATIRVRIDGDLAFLTIKGRTTGITRGEWEYPIPTEDARELLAAFCGPRLIDKTRHVLRVGEHEWTVDEFRGRHAGLLLAEIELEADDEPFEHPPWLGEEVSDDPRYFNSSLAKG